MWKVSRKSVRKNSEFWCGINSEKLPQSSTCKIESYSNSSSAHTWTFSRVLNESRHASHIIILLGKQKPTEAETKADEVSVLAHSRVFKEFMSFFLDEFQSREQTHFHRKTDFLFKFAGIWKSLREKALEEFPWCRWCEVTDRSDGVWVEFTHGFYNACVAIP